MEHTEQMRENVRTDEYALLIMAMEEIIARYDRDIKADNEIGINPDYWKEHQDQAKKLLERLENAHEIKIRVHNLHKL